MISLIFYWLIQHQDSLENGTVTPSSVSEKSWQTCCTFHLHNLNQTRTQVCGKVSPDHKLYYCHWMTLYHSQLSSVIPLSYCPDCITGSEDSIAYAYHFFHTEESANRRYELWEIHFKASKAVSRNSSLCLTGITRFSVCRLVKYIIACISKSTLYGTQKCKDTMMSFVQNTISYF